MSRNPNLRGALWIIVLGWAGTSGCTHNYYYGNAVPGCPPGTQTFTTQTQTGSVCDMPSSGKVIVTNGSPSAVSSSVTPQPPTASASGQPRIVISQPSYGPPSIGQNSGWMKWRKPDPDNIPIMKAEGGVDDSTIR